MQVRIWGEAQTGAAVRVSHGWKYLGIAISIQTDRVERRVRHTQAELLAQSGLHELCTDLHVVCPMYIGNVRAHTPIGQTPRLLGTYRRVLKPIIARIVADLILPEEWIDGQQNFRRKGVLVARSDIVTDNFLALVLPKLVICIGGLEPIARMEQIEMQRVSIVRMKIEPVKDSVVVPDGVNRPEFVSIEKTA